MQFVINTATCITQFWSVKVWVLQFNWKCGCSCHFQVHGVCDKRERECYEVSDKAKQIERMARKQKHRFDWNHSDCLMEYRIEYKLMNTLPTLAHTHQTSVHAHTYHPLLSQTFCLSIPEHLWLVLETWDTSTSIKLHFPQNYFTFSPQSKSTTTGRIHIKYIMRERIKKKNPKRKTL